MSLEVTDQFSNAYGSAAFAITREVYEFQAARMRTARAQLQAFEARFRRNVDQWREDTIFMSSLREVVAHPAYQAIIRMGHEAVPLILAILKETPEHWGPALQAITGANPVPAEACGRVDAIADAWLQWGNDHGLVP
jgi:hypothetical protein